MNDDAIGEQHDEPAVVWIESEAPFPDLETAAAGVGAVVARLRGLTPRWFMWHPARVQRVELLLKDSLAERVAACEVGRDPGGGTYFMGLRCRSGSGPDDVSILVRVGAGAEGPGMVAVVDLDPAYRPDELRAWIDELSAIDGVDSIWVGPRPIVERERAGWLTFERKAEIVPLPDGATFEHTSRGLYVIAHEQGEASRADAAVLAIRAVAHALGRRQPEHQRRMNGEPPSAAIEVEQLAVPTYLRDVEAPMAPSPNPDETAMLPSPLYVKPALPFSGETTPERLEQIAGPAPDTHRAPKEAKEGFDPDETAMVPSPLAKLPSTGTFRDQLGTVDVPILSLEEYADLRARLAVHGEDDAETLERFGVKAPAVHRALKARFAEYFKREPEAQQRFVTALQARISALRSPGATPLDAGAIAEVEPEPQPSAPMGTNAVETAEIDVRSVPDLLRARGIPFPDAQEPAATSEPLRTTPEAADESSRTDTGTEEIDLRTLDLGAHPFDATFSEAGVPSSLDSSSPVLISVERFAEIQGALSRSRDRDGVLGHYGFTAQSWAPASREMGVALSADSTLHARYEQLYREAMSRAGKQ